MLYGQDWSSYQSATPSTEGLSFCGIKVTEGLDYVNPRWRSQLATARKAGLVTIFYHYPHIANSSAAEADYFLRQLTLKPGDILALDWEWYGQSVTDAAARAYKDAFVSRVRLHAPGHRIVVYSNRSDWVDVDTDSNCGDGLWIADPTTAGKPRIRDPWVFHQYGSNPVDKDVANFATVAALKAWAAGTTTPNQQEGDLPTPEDVWAYRNTSEKDPGDMHALLTAVYKAVVAPSIKSQVDGVDHTLGEHEATTNADVIDLHTRLTKVEATLTAIARKLGV